MNQWKYIALILPTLVGCGGSLASVSAGHIGCAPSQIQVSDEDFGFNAANWTATCGESVYTCSSVRNEVACTPLGGEQTPSAAPPRIPAPAPSTEASSSPPAKTKWVRQALEQCGVEAEFPSKPQLGSEKTNTKNASFTTYTAIASHEDEWAIALTCSRIAAMKTAKWEPTPKVLDAMRDSAVKAVSGELVSEREIIGGREIDFSRDGQVSRSRLLVLDDRLVTATVTPVSALSSARLAQFFRSVETQRE